MRINVGTPDRVARFVIGAVLVLLPLPSCLPPVHQALWLWASIVLGAVLIVTAPVRFCPLYAIVGLSTRKVSSS